jgi:hypothetical protein
MNRASSSGLSRAKLRRRTVLGLLRSLATAIVLVVLYYQLPLDHVKNVPVALVVGLVILAAATVGQLRMIGRSPLPAIRAIEALAATIPLFLLLFASAYVVMADANPANFSTQPLTRTDALYFTVTVFSTVGFGDITAVSQSARVVVTVQMVLDLAALGLVVRAFVSAVQTARQQAAPDTRPPRDDNAGLPLAFEDPILDAELLLHPGGRSLPGYLDSRLAIGATGTRRNHDEPHLPSD